MKKEVYYDRVLKDELVEIIKERYQWLINYVKEHNELDFQVGSNKSKTWFSVYRGTGRVLSISKTGKLSAAETYMKLLPEFYKNPTKKLFNELLDKIEKEPNLGRYYINDKGEYKEGYYQNLIGRRYTFLNNDDDSFIIIDKELVIGFENTTIKKEWNESIVGQTDGVITKVRAEIKSLPKDIKNSYGEFDFLGLNWNGDIIIMELKQNDPTKTYLSPIQIAYYNEQFKKLLDKITPEKLYENIKGMIEQKIDLGVLRIPNNRQLPEKLSGKILNYLIVGEDQELSPEICDRYRKIREVVGLDIKSCTCKLDGTLIVSEKLG